MNKEQAIEHLKSLNSIRNNSEKIVTRLYYTENDYVEDFSYFIFPFECDASGKVVNHSHYLSDGLAFALINNLGLSQFQKDELNKFIIEKRLPEDEDVALTEAIREVVKDEFAKLGIHETLLTQKEYEKLANVTVVIGNPSSRHESEKFVEAIKKHLKNSTLKGMQ